MYLGPGAQAQSALADQVAEAKIKAVFICKFGNYVEWPPREGTPQDAAFVIGVVAGNVIVEELIRAAGTLTVNNRPISVRRLAPGDPVDGLAILVIGRSNERLTETLASARGKPILTITESENAKAAGGIVNFVVVDDRVRFDIALPAAEQSNLKISGRLLAVARAVIGRPL
jgi:hypothetical protein